MKTALLLLALLCAGNAVADTLYKCTDRGSDTVLYTNQRASGKSCTVLSSVQGQNFGSTSSRKASANPTPGDFPRVSSDKQKERDSTRRTILEQELANEQRNLDAAKKDNNPNKAQLHERNIAALQKEIAHLK